MISQLNSYNHFNKRIYRFSSFIQDLANALRNLKGIRNTIQSQRISKKFAERVMLAVTSVNECIYCEWAHTRMALEDGCSIEEIRELMESNFKNVPKKELIAITFAQHYAETGGRPSKGSLKRLLSEYGVAKSVDILNYCQMITIGNLLGNTVSAFLNRIRGISPKNGSIIFELLVFIFGGFFVELSMRKR